MGVWVCSITMCCVHQMFQNFHGDENIDRNNSSSFTCCTFILLRISIYAPLLMRHRSCSPAVFVIRLSSIANTWHEVPMCVLPVPSSKLGTCRQGRDGRPKTHHQAQKTHFARWLWQDGVCGCQCTLRRERDEEEKDNQGNASVASNRDLDQAATPRTT